MRRLIPAGLVLVTSLVLCTSPRIQAVPEGGGRTVDAQTSELPLNPNSVRFAVIGDNGSGDRGEYETAGQMDKFQQSSQFSFVIMLGDNLYGGSSPDDYENKFARPYKSLLDKGVKFYASLGNHDNTNERLYAPFNMNGRRYYTFIRGEVEFFVLDSNYMDVAQLNWLRTELAKSTSHWKIAYFHHPLFSSGKSHGSDTDLRTVLEPVFRKYGINVVLAGHEHVYERVVPQSGILYFVMGSSGKLRAGGLADDSLKTAGFDSDQCFMVVEIAGDEFYFQAISRSGKIVDSGAFKRQTPGSQ